MQRFGFGTVECGDLHWARSPSGWIALLELPMAAQCPEDKDYDDGSPVEGVVVAELDEVFGAVMLK